MSTYCADDIKSSNSNMLYTSTIIVIAVFLDLRWSFTRCWFVDWEFDCFIVVGYNTWAKEQNQQIRIPRRSIDFWKMRSFLNGASNARFKIEGDNGADYPLTYKIWLVKSWPRGSCETLAWAVVNKACEINIIREFSLDTGSILLFLDYDYFYV